MRTRDAHLRLMAQLPVRTHQAKPYVEPPAYRAYRLNDPLVQKIFAMDAVRPKMSRTQIAKACGVSCATVTKYLGVRYPNLGPRRFR